jgi:hypothetical protein
MFKFFGIKNEVYFFNNGKVIMDKEFIIVITAVLLFISGITAFTIWGISSYIPLNKSEWTCTGPVVDNEDPSSTDCVVYTKKGVTR